MRPQAWSYDAWAVVQPRRAFACLAKHLPQSSTWTGLRRPLAFAVGLGCAVSVFAAGLLTLRIAVTATLYWAYVPAAEIVGLAAATRGVRRVSASQKIDAFFVGHGPATLFVLALWAALTLHFGDEWWRILSGRVVGVWLLVLVWGAYVDVCCFREVMQMPHARALAALLLQRGITWGLVFGVFAVPRPGLFIREIVESLGELL